MAAMDTQRHLLSAPVDEMFALFAVCKTHELYRAIHISCASYKVLKIDFATKI